MQAIGVLISLPSTGVHPGPLNLWQHVSFLERHLADAHDMDNDQDQYHVMEEYYHTHRYQPTSTQQLHYYITPVPLNIRYFQPFESVPYALAYYVESSVFPLSSERLQQQQQWHTQDIPRAFSDMVLLLGPSVFVLWKAILLKQRILMMKPSPPMKKTCYFVYNAYLMDQWQSSTTPAIQSHMALKFNIGINDINELEKHHDSSYVACTSDTIFDIKKDLYDVLIKFPASNGSTMQPLESITTSTPITVNAADRVRFRLLMHLFPLNQQQQQPIPCSWTFCRYDWITWCDASISHVVRQWHASDTTAPHRTQRYPHHEQQQDQAQEYEHSVESMHSLQETSLLTTPSQQPISEAQERRMGSQVILDDTRLPARTASAPQATSHGSLAYSDRPDQVLAWGSSPTVLSDTLSNTLLGFFHVLSLQLVSSLQTLVENEDDDDSEVVVLGIQDMVRLGLDPWDDRYLVQQLGHIYFQKEIKVSVCHDVKTCCGSSCCAPSGAPIQL
ncbi:unnamed protein product [Absidia cylindrospora]